MKTSVIEVHALLSVFGVLGVEKRIREVPGVESATVNFAVGNATVRYDETRLDIADIKAFVRQSAYHSGEPVAVASEASPETPFEQTPESPSAPPTESTLAPQPPTPVAVVRESSPTASAGAGPEGKTAPGPQPVMSADMAREMGHGAKDLPAMVR